MELPDAVIVSPYIILESRCQGRCIIATYYVGSGGNDGNSGLTWALRKLTLNAAEDVPVVADDTVYVGPGVYRELLTVDVNGGAGTEIVYIGDVTGENTDQVGGIVRITGSDDDQTTARANCIFASARDYRIFRGFSLDTTSQYLIRLTSGCTNITIEDYVFQNAGTQPSVEVGGAGQAATTIRRCVFLFARDTNIEFTHSADVEDTGHLVENCYIGFAGLDSIYINNIGDITIRNCTLAGAKDDLIDIYGSLAVGQTVTVENCILFGAGGNALESTTLGDLVEDYNTFYGNNADRSNVNVGGNSQTYPPLFIPPILNAGAGLVSGFKFPWWMGELSEWSQLTLTGNAEPTEDLRGIERPATATKNTWGAHQFQDFERETGTVRTGSVSAVLHDAGIHQIIVPVTATSTTINVYVYREANYAGVSPRMIIKQPGQADDTTTDAAAASQWNLLTTTLTPAADPPYVIVELKSLNTAVAGNYDVFWDDLEVS